MERHRYNGVLGTGLRLHVGLGGPDGLLVHLLGECLGLKVWELATGCADRFFGDHFGKLREHHLCVEFCFNFLL